MSEVVDVIAHVGLVKVGDTSGVGSGREGFWDGGIREVAGPAATVGGLHHVWVEASSLMTVRERAKVMTIRERERFE